MAPDLAPLVEHLKIFQRSSAWVVPTLGYRDRLPDEALWLDANVPYYTNWSRFVMGWILGDHKLFSIFDVDPDWPDPLSVNAENQAARQMALAHLENKLKGRPDLIAKSIPDYPIFANRPVLDNGWFDALLRDNVELVTDRIERFTPEGIVTADGRSHPLDLVVMATGFNPNDYFSEIEIIGRDGVRIADLWAETGPQAYWGVMVPHMPNLFILYGPNANPRNPGPVQYGEWALGFILRTIKRIIENDWDAFEVKESAYHAFNERLVERLQHIVSVNPRTTHASYYITQPGRSAVQSPWSSAEVRAAFTNMRDEDFLIEPAGGSLD
ncbi:MULTISPECIES: flavin-containing monooxygenase [Sphingobium]|uniref:flavin-containing monooxygenase n=1 Tax=Sphingobium sp. MI1205 TaxID=407020 RepID=UPI0007704560|nr:NAD(P)/FAD-dependent oxidoreductase [Sphingobium sp. MI1205]AMK19928.1 flavin-containing monooxygenase-like protein [Sphingobium sp. MI1205]